MHVVFQYGLAAMMAWAAPGLNPSIESKEDGLIRYNSIMTDLVSVVFDPKEKPAFEGKDGRVKTYFLMLSIAAKESHFTKDVDSGKSNGDDGQSVCLMQIRFETPYSKTNDGFKKQDLMGESNRKNCFRAALHKIHESYDLCKYMQGSDKLAGYTHGKCKKNEPAAKFRYNRAVNFILNNKIEFIDDDVFDLVTLPFEYWDFDIAS